MAPTHLLADDVVERLMAATNAHDLDALTACFAEDYILTNPLHPARGFAGREQVRRNWQGIFAGVPDVTTTVRDRADSAARAGEPWTDTVWLELQMSGTRRDGHPHEMVGVMIFGVADGLIRSGRFYLDPVDHAPVDVDAAVRAAMRGSS